MASPFLTSDPTKLRISIRSLARSIDHSLLHPTFTDIDLSSGMQLSLKYSVATACIKPYAIPLAKSILSGSPVKICPVIAFPHGNSSTRIKVLEAEDAAEQGGQEIDMVVNIGKVLSGEWEYVEEEIRAINDAVVKKDAILKVIFENDYLEDRHIIKLCEICTRVGVAFVKTSTGYGFVKQADGSYNYKGATPEHLKLMQIKAAGGVRTLDDLLRVLSLGVTRVGSTATMRILKEAEERGIGDEIVEVDVPAMGAQNGSGAY
jgi:deoxyribose-phosphate aldolase